MIPSPPPVPVSVVQQMKMLIKETLSPVLCVCVSVSVRVTRQRGASNPCPATARQLNGSVSSPARNEQCMIYFRTQFACFFKPATEIYPLPYCSHPFHALTKPQRVQFGHGENELKNLLKRDFDSKIPAMTMRKKVVEVRSFLLKAEGKVCFLNKINNKQNS